MWNFLAQVGWMIVAAVIQVALAPKPPTPKAATLADVDAPIAEDGVEIPVVFGTVWLRGSNVLWYGDMGTKAIKTKGGKK